jgi:hypothetical protein
MSKTETLHLDSLSDLIDRTNDPKRIRWTSSSRSRDTNDREWFGTANWTEALDLVRKGWPEGREKMARAMSVAAQATNHATAPSMALDVAGAYPMIPAAVAGDPMNMVSFAPVEDRRRPIVRLFVSCVYSAGYSANAVMNYGAALMAYVDALEETGHRTEITMTYLSDYRGQRIMPSVLAKRAEDALDVDRMAFVIAHPSFLRRLMFGLLETVPEWEASHAGGYGLPTTPKRDELPEDVIYLPGVNALQGAALVSPAAAVKALAPIADRLLMDRHGIQPPLHFDFA